MKNYFLTIIAIFSLIISSCTSEESPESLKALYESYFDIGVAVGKDHLSNYDTVLIKKHFSSLTAENDMKPERTINRDMEFTFEEGDRIVEFAQENGMKIRGHTLVWYSQTPDWFYQDETGNLLTSEAMLERMHWYINEVLDHYRGKIYAWDVVNEAVSDLNDKFYRDDVTWFEICGPDYIEQAFRFAREADPEVKLFYNDYNLIDPDKARKVYKMVKEMLEKGVPIDGIGMQGHWTLEDVNAENLATSIDLFGSLGLEVHITEVDLSIYPFYHNIPRDSLPKEVRAFTEAVETEQAEKYREIFNTLREKSDIVTSVTMWGLADNKSWLSNYFVRGRTDHPLLFDAEYQPKKSFDAITKF